jgi:hypothetical protein
MPKSNMVLALAIVLTGCALTPEQRAARAIERYAPYCEKLGYERGTDRWRDCIASEESARRARAASVTR